MNLTKEKSKLVFLSLWLISYLLVYLLLNKNPLSIIPVYIGFVIAMYVGDIKFRAWGLIHKIDMREPVKEDISAFASSSSLATFAAITIGLLAFTVGYAVSNSTIVGWILKVLVILILISTVSYLFTLEAQETSLRRKWGKEEKDKFDLFIRFLHVIGWHTLFLYLLLIVSFIGNFIFFVAIVTYTVFLFYYYCLVD